MFMWMHVKRCKIYSQIWFISLKKKNLLFSRLPFFFHSLILRCRIEFWYLENGTGLGLRKVVVFFFRSKKEGSINFWYQNRYSNSKTSKSAFFDPWKSNDSSYFLKYHLQMKRELYECIKIFQYSIIKKMMINHSSLWSSFLARF